MCDWDDIVLASGFRAQFGHPSTRRGCHICVRQCTGKQMEDPLFHFRLWNYPNNWAQVHLENKTVQSIQNTKVVSAKAEKKKAYTTTTERKSLGELFWPQRKTFQAGGGHKNPIKQGKPYPPPKSFLCGPHFP